MYPSGWGTQTGFPYWQVYQTWVSVVYDLLPIDLNQRVFLSPGSARSLAESGVSSYRYSTSFAGAPQLWMPGATADPSAQQGRTIDEVIYPTSKAILWDAELGWLGHPPNNVDGDIAEQTPIAFADGSVIPRVPIEASEAAPNPFESPVSRRRLHNTAAGVRGRDF